MPARTQSASPTEYRFAFDIGGTFTDIVVSDGRGRLHTTKVLSRPEAITRAVVEGLLAVVERDAIPRERIHEAIAGATTVVTNLIIEGKGAATGLITTAGFPDLIEIARENRYDIYDIKAALPRPLIPRERRKEVPERVSHDGRVLVALDETAARGAIEALLADGVMSIAVCFLHAYRYPAHERRVREIAAQVAPHLHVSLSSEVLPEIREYERIVATALNAYVQPHIGRYLEELERALSDIGIDATLHIMQSNGGVITRAFAEALPLRMLESGPAAGALAAAHVAADAGLRDVLSFDMGGTTAKSCLVTDGRPAVTTDFETARVHRFKKGSGYPVKLPVIDVMEIGAGGGSIARIDETGLLKVGPESAGANPGPACYGLGGKEPTVTDAALVLGYLDPARSLSDRVKLHPERAEQAIHERIAKPLGMAIVEAAQGIHRVVCEAMASAAEVHAVERGKDIRRYTLVAFGGAGPMHAREVARRLRCTKILVPANAGVFSAVGLLTAPVMTDAVRTFYTLVDHADWAQIDDLYRELESQTAEAIVKAGVARDAVAFERSADMRYVGQGFEINVPLPPRFDGATRDAAVASFHRVYDEIFSHHLTNVRIEALNWRLKALAPLPRGALFTQAAVPERERGPHTKRCVHFMQSSDAIEVPVWSDGSLATGREYEGPALIEQSGSTSVVGPGERFIVDTQGNLVISLPARAAAG
jgi:N-methylhydantoinase A/oxoprolinase/acetone carboxylase beta subunit